MSPATPAAPPTEIVKRLRDALVRIHDGDNSCLCDHNTPECCEAVGEHCPSCIAAKALEALAVWNAGPATPTPEGWQQIETAPKDTTVVLANSHWREPLVGRWFSDCPGWFTAVTQPLKPPPTHWMMIPPLASGPAVSPQPEPPKVYISTSERIQRLHDSIDTIHHRCVCQGKDKIKHTHYNEDDYHGCARCGRDCKNGYTPVEPLDDRDLLPQKPAASQPPAVPAAPQEDAK